MFTFDLHSFLRVLLPSFSLVSDFYTISVYFSLSQLFYDLVDFLWDSYMVSGIGSADYWKENKIIVRRFC